MFDSSSDSDQTCLLTRVLIEWGRNKIMDYFRWTEHQARAPIERKAVEGISEFSRCFRGNEPVDRQTIGKIHEH